MASLQQQKEELYQEYVAAYRAGRHDQVNQIVEKLNAITSRSCSINERGNLVARDRAPGNRYRYDLDECSAANGWLQFDTSQDASYFGLWVNKKMLRTVTYCEGDENTVICPDAEHFDAEIADACGFYQEGRIATAIGDGKATSYHQNRQVFFTTYVEPPEEDELAAVPELIRTAATRICQNFSINGICDPMYICNVIASELKLGDGKGCFTPLAMVTSDYTVLDLRRLANRLNSAYSTCVGAGDTFAILKPIFWGNY